MQDSTWHAPSKTLGNKTPDKNLADDFQALTLNEDGDRQDLPNTQANKVEPENNNKEEEKKSESPIPEYVVTEQERRLQEGEEKCNIYIGMIGYEGDDSDLDSEMDTELEKSCIPVFRLRRKILKDLFIINILIGLKF